MERNNIEQYDADYQTKSCGSLSDARNLALKVHKGQVDKGGAP